MPDAEREAGAITVEIGVKVTYASAINRCLWITFSSFGTGIYAQLNETPLYLKGLFV